MKKYKFVFVFLLTFIFSIDCFGLNKSFVEKKIKTLNSALESKKSDYIKLRLQYKVLTKKIELTNKKIAKIKSDIKHKKSGLKILNRKITLLKKDVVSVSYTLEFQKQQLYKELREYYKYSKISRYYKKGIWYEYMNNFIGLYMQDKIKKYVSRRSYLKSRIESLNALIEKKVNILKNIKEQERDLKKENVQLTAFAKKASRQKKVYLNEIATLQKEQEKLRSVLSDIIKKERIERLKALKRKQKRKKRHIVSVKKQQTVDIKTVEREFKALKNRINPPVRGKIVDTFGKKYDTLFKVYTRNDGIDIKASKGSCVRVIYGGKIDYIGRLPGYGHLVIVNHLNGYYSVYGGVLTRLKIGSRVKKYQCIGNMESSKLHFEIRRHAVAINPLIFLNKGALR